MIRSETIRNEIVAFTLPRQWQAKFYCYEKIANFNDFLTSVFDRRTYPVLRSTCSWRVNTYVG